MRTSRGHGRPPKNFEMGQVAVGNWAGIGTLPFPTNGERSALAWQRRAMDSLLDVDQVQPMLYGLHKGGHVDAVNPLPAPELAVDHAGQLLLVSG